MASKANTSLLSERLVFDFAPDERKAGLKMAVIRWSDNAENSVEAGSGVTLLLAHCIGSRMWYFSLILL